MLVCMRTTLNLPDALAAAAKAQAAAEGQTFTSFLEQALRERLAAVQRASPVSPLPTFGDPATSHFLIDIDDHDALWDALDAHGADVA